MLGHGPRGQVLDGIKWHTYSLTGGGTVDFSQFSFNNVSGSGVLTTQSGDQALKLFYSAANDSNVEWKAAALNDGDYFVATSYNPDLVQGNRNLGFADSNVKAFIHSHPKGFGYRVGGYTDFQSEKISMGYKDLVDRNPNLYMEGDWQRLHYANKRTGNNAPLSYVYFPDSRRIWRVGSYEPHYIKHANNGHASFRFGPFR